MSDVLRLTAPSAVLLSGDARFENFDITRALFFDLETSGLLGGSENISFLTGVLRVQEHGGVEVQQILIRDPRDEPIALELVAELLDDADYLVSFNGKSFDRNVLADRFAMHRMSPDRVLDLPHLDLLHPARRIFRGPLGSCTLGRIEEQLLGVHRHESEVRGAEVPERWFDFLQTGRFHLLEPILDHNLLDVLSLASLAGFLSRAVEAPGIVSPEPAALLGVARLLEERGQLDRARSVLELVARGHASCPLAYAALSRLANLCRRAGHYEEALDHWERMSEVCGTSDLEPWIGRAIALEHRLGRPACALDLIQDLLERVAGRPWAVNGAEREALSRRRDRLRLKVAKSRSGPAQVAGLGRGGCVA
ncbi:MAG: ribonuclease H-like domain-containing protein [Myxococcota bacterium]|nr:ribonuclease H-like domain-containing protein [Myxococcota bacterium]